MDVKRVDGLEGDLVVGHGNAGGQRNAAQIEVPLQAGVVRSPHGEQVAARVVPACDGIAVVAVEVGAGDKADRVLVEGIAVRVERARHHVHALHPVAGAEADGALNRDGVGGGQLLAREIGEVRGGDGVDAVERGDVVVAQQGGVGDALPAARPADAAQRLHHRPALRAAGFAVGERAGIDLGIVEAEDAAEGALDLVAHHLDEIAGRGAAAVEEDDGVGDGGVGFQVVHPHVDSIVLAGVRLARAGAVDGIDDRAVIVVEDGQRIVGGRGRHVGGRGDRAGGVDLDVGAADVFVQRSLVREGDAGGGNGAPEGGGGIDHGRGLLVGDGARERTLVDVVVHLAARPVDGLACDGGVEVAGSGHVFGAAGEG